MLVQVGSLSCGPISPTNAATNLIICLRTPIFSIGFAQQHGSSRDRKHRLVPARDRGHSQNVARLIERVNPVFDITAEDHCLVL